MSIVLLVGGSSEHGNVQHRYVASEFLARFGQQVDCIITAKPTKRPFTTRLKRLIKRGNYVERFARARYGGNYGPSEEDLQPLLRPQETDGQMPGGDRRIVVNSHNGPECEAILEARKPQVIAVYGTGIIRSNIFAKAQRITLNMHTGLSPFYRGDSTLFWPVYYNEPEHLGVTVHELVESVDGGAIAATAPVVYEPGDTEAHLFAKGVKAGTRIYLNAVEEALAGTLTCTPQDLSKGQEFRWIHRTVAAEHQVRAQLDIWSSSLA